MCSQLYLELLLVSILLLIYHGTTNAAYHNQHKRITKRKSHDFFSGSSHLETLSWAVKLSFDPELYTKQELDMVADLVALETSLDNLGQIGEFKGHYFFIHKFHKDTTKHITNSYQENYWNDTATDSPEYEDSSESMTGDSQEWRRNLTEAEWWRVKEQIHDQLDGHHYVQWHMQQLVRSRQKRFYEFNDPMFPKQWHLVSGYPLISLSSCTLPLFCLVAYCSLQKISCQLSAYAYTCVFLTTYAHVRVLHVVEGLHLHDSSLIMYLSSLRLFP